MYYSFFQVVESGKKVKTVEKLTNNDLLNEILVSDFDEAAYEMSTYYKQVTIVIAGSIQVNGD